MISNQTNEGHRLRLYGQNERASSTSSTGPKWTSSISDLLVNRSNTIRFNNQASQSHQTSQHQLLGQPASHQQIHHQAPQAPSTADGNRLMMKLMNINLHHQNTNVSSNAAHTFDHPRLSGSRDDQKRLALDECTNYLQQKTMQQQQFPSSSLAISNIINSNRSASSAGVQVPQNGASQSTSNAAKKFQAFKFNLTLNKNKALNTQKGADVPAFYQAPTDNALPSNQEQEDNDAMIINDKQRSKIQGTGVSRGPSQLAMKQHLKQMIKSYEDQPEALAQTNPIESTQKFDHHHETQHIQNEQQITYDNTYRLAQVVHAQQAASKLAAAVHGQSVSKPLEKKVVEMDERQKIFEEEIIKRVKEIQNYAKTLHMHLKKLQQSQTKKGEELQSAKEQILQLKEMALGKEDLNEQNVSEMVENRLKILDGEVTVQIEHLEQKLVKDYDAKINRQSKSSINDLHSMSQSLKEEIYGQIQEELLTNFKSEILKQVSEKVKEASRVQEKSINELRGVLQDKNQQAEDLEVEYKGFQKDMISRNEKLSKSVKDGQEHTDETINVIGEALRVEMENLRKKIIRDVKADIDQKQYISQVDLTDQLSKMDLAINTIQGQMSQKLQESSSSAKDQGLQYKLQELEEYVHGQLANIDQEIQSANQSTTQQDEKIRSNQEALLSLKSNQSTSAVLFEDRIYRLEESIKTETQMNQSLFQSLQKSVKTLSEEPKIDREQITMVLDESVQPQLDNQTEAISELQQQNELFKQQLTQKLMRSELQEIKQDIDDEIKSLEKVLKKHDERSVTIESAQQSMKQQLQSIEENNAQQYDHAKQDMDGTNKKIDQLSADIQSKTGDIYEEVQEIQSQISELQTMKKENYEAPKNSNDQITSLQKKLDNHIAEVNNKLPSEKSTMQDQESVDQKIEEVKQGLIELIQQQQAGKTDDAIESKLKQQREQIDELLDETIMKINELDGRISQIEEKDTTVLIDEDKTTLNIEHYEALQNQIQELKAELESKIESSIKPFKSHSEQFDLINIQFEEHRDIQSKNEESNKESFENVTHDLQAMRELYVCLQDVMITEEQLISFKVQTGQSIDDKLINLKTENLKLASEVEHLKLTLVDKINEVRVDLNKEKENSEKMTLTITELNEKIEQLEQSRENVVPAPQIVSARRNVQEIEIDEPIYPQQRHLQVSSNPVGTSRSQQNNINFLTTPRANEAFSPEQQQRQLDTQYQGHFLENLSEVVSSPNNIGNHTNNDGDMMMFNRQSIGGSSIMSNRLMTPIEQRNLFQFNSQVTGQRLIMPAQQNANGSSVFDQEEELKSQHDSVKIASSASKKSFKTPSSVLQVSPFLAQEQQDPVIVEHNDKDEQSAMQQMNISLESARNDDKSDENVQDRNVFSPGSPHGQQNVHVERLSLGQESDQHNQSNDSGVQDGQPLQFNVEERFGDEDDESNPNVEEVLQALINISGDHHNQEIIEEEEKNATPRVSHPGQVNDENEDQEDSQQPQILLLSPTNTHSQQLLHHHNPHTNLQNNHFVAFESDEEDSQQYDLLPINHSRVGSNSAPPQQLPLLPAENVSSQHSNQNRYYESGSGGEEDKNEEPEEQDNLGQEFDDIEVESAGIQLRQYLQENDDDEEEGKDDADYDDSPIENHHSNHRFDMRHEEVNRRISTNSQLAAAVASEERQVENDNDEEFQEIQHETLSSHRGSEFSAPQSSRRSGSLNIDHNHDNIDENGGDQDEESLVGPQYPEIDLDDSRENMLSEIVAEEEEGKVMVIDNDDWNLEEIEEEEKQADDGPLGLSKKAEVVAAQIVQEEIINCIKAALGLKNRFNANKQPFSLW